MIPLNYIRIGIAVAFVVLLVLCYGLYERGNAAKADLDSFTAQVKAAGEAQEKVSKARDIANQQKKEQADNENAKTRRDLAGVYAAYGKLRAQHTYSSLLPSPGPSADSADAITLNRAKLDRGMAEADGLLQDGAAKILRRGDEAITDLNTARAWAK